MNKIKNTTFVKNLLVGQRFLAATSDTEMVATSVRTGGGHTVVQYSTDSGGRGEFHKPSLATITIL